MDDWEAVKGRLGSDADVIDQQALAADTHEEMLSLRRFAADIRAALERMDEQQKLLDAKWGHEISGAIVADEVLSLRQRVEELEQSVLTYKHRAESAEARWKDFMQWDKSAVMYDWKQKAEAAEAKLAEAIAAMERHSRDRAAWQEKWADSEAKLAKVVDMLEQTAALSSPVFAWPESGRPTVRDHRRREGGE